MNMALGALVLALFWALITDGFSLPNLALGAGIGWAALWVVRDRMGASHFLHRLRRILSLALLFLYELSLSAIKVGWLVVQPDLRRRLKPALIAYPLTVQSPAEITLLANLITLTPGTLSVDVSEDRKTLYVHAVTMDDRAGLIDGIAKGFEARIMRIFQ